MRAEPPLPPFDAVLDAHGIVVMRVCRALLGPSEADDAWSETFLAALEAYPRLRPGSDVRAWLVTIAHRKAVDRLRASARRPVPVGELPHTPSSHGLPTEVDDALWAALASLSPKQRAAVAYHHVAGLPYAEVGSLLGTSEAAARRSAADGIANLRRRYPAQEAQ